MHKKLLFLLMLFSIQYASGQEMWGISNSNYSGNMGIFLNPSTIVGAPYRYELNVLAGDFFAENTYVYFPKEKNIVINGLFGSLDDGKHYRASTDSVTQSGFGHVLIIGPSYIDDRDDFAWGIHTAFRSEGSVSDVPYVVSRLLVDNFRTPALFNRRFSSTPFSTAMASWAEIGGTYGSVIMDSEKHYLKWGANANLMLGFNGMYLDVRSLDFTMLDTSIAEIHSMDATFAHAINTDGDDSFFGLRGAGLGTTAGITYMYKRNSGGFECNRNNDRVKKYVFRAGASLMDLGLIHYFSDTRITEINTNVNRLWTGIDTTEFGSFRNFNTMVLQRIGGTIDDKDFNIWLPLAAGVQFDYSITPKFYANLSLVNRLKFAPNQIARGNQVNLSVRYETRPLEANINYSMFEYNQSSLGVGFRYKWLVLGSDRLLQLFGLSDVYAADFFFGIKFSLCRPLFSPGEDCAAFQ